MYNGIIYKYTSPSGKVYIGQTYNEKCRRQVFFNMNKSYGGQKIDNARKKYGPNNFEYEILFSIKTDDRDYLMQELNEKEEYYIHLYDSINSGYNTIPGGSSYHDYVYTKEVREKMAEISSKAVIQYSLDGEFIKDWKSASEAGRVLGIQPSLISKCCNRATKHCREFIFRFAGDVVADNEKNPTVNNTKNLKVYQIQDDSIINTWKSITAAAKDLGFDRHRLSNLLKAGPLSFNETTIILG